MECRSNQIMGIGDERVLNNYVKSCPCEQCVKKAWVDVYLGRDSEHLYNLLFNSQQQTITTDNTGDFQQ